MKNFFYVLFFVFLVGMSITIADKVLFTNTVQAEQLVVTNTLDNAAVKATVTKDLKVAYEKQIISETSGDFITENWGKLLIALLGFYDVVARLTPTIKDNTIVTFLLKIINALIPNIRSSGGVF